MHTDTRILLHVGLPKTATTAIQVHLFGQLPGVCSIGKPYMQKPLKKALRRVIAESAVEFSSVALTPIRDVLLGGDGQTVVLSHEGLSATRHEMRAGDRFLRQGGFRAHRRLVAERLREACGAANAQVVFTIREQCAWLLSLYADLVHREGLRAPFDAWVDEGLDCPEDFIGDPDFHWLIGEYAAHFGDENVHVLAFEDLLQHPERFAKRLAAAGYLDEAEVLCRVSSLPRMKSRDEMTRGAYATPSRHRKSQCLAGIRPPEIPDEVPFAQRERIGRYCVVGNRRLAERFGLALAEHGYVT